MKKTGYIALAVVTVFIALLAQVILKEFGYNDWSVVAPLIMGAIIIMLIKKIKAIK